MDELSVLTKAAIDGVEGVARTLTKPDDDWVPVVFVERESGEITVVAAVQAFASQANKELFFDSFLPNMIHEMGLIGYAVVASAWMADPDPLSRKGFIVRPSLSPNRYEVVSILTVTARGTASCSARIQRHQSSPPTLAAWEHQPPIAKIEGLMVDAGLAAIRGRTQHPRDGGHRRDAR